MPDWLADWLSDMPWPREASASKNDQAEFGLDNWVALLPEENGQKHSCKKDFGQGCPTFCIFQIKVINWSSTEAYQWNIFRGDSLSRSHVFPHSNTQSVCFFQILCQIATYCPVWSHMVPYGLLWSLMVPYCPIWSLIVPFGSVWSHMVPYGLLWSRLVPYGPVWSYMVLYSLVWSLIYIYISD